MFGLFQKSVTHDEAIEEVVDEITKNGYEGGMKAALKVADHVSDKNVSCKTLFDDGVEAYQEKVKSKKSR
jgi:hypothetical protein